MNECTEFLYGVRSEEGEKILNSATSYDLVITYTYFKGMDEHLFTYKKWIIFT